MLSTLHDSRRGGRPVAAISFLILCILVSIPAFFFSSFRESVSGLAVYREHPWQAVTAVFLHGWPGFPGILHLALNAVLIVECGWPCERLLGTGRFLVLSLAALAIGAAAIAATDGVNGSSVVIWAWGPSLFVALRAAPATAADAEARRRLRGVLVIMYVVVTLAMPLIPYALGWRGSFLYAIVAGNRYHLIATAVGVVFAAAQRGWIARRMESLAQTEA